MTTKTTTPRKSAPRKSTGARKRIGPQAVQEDWTKLPLAEQVKRMAWLHNELLYSLRIEFAKLAMQNPQVQAALAQRMAEGNL